MIPASPHIARMAPYTLADLTGPDGKPLASLAQNESLRGPSPLAVEAAAKAVTECGGYPDPEWTALRKALEDVYHVDPDSILCGNGSLDLIGSIARAFAGPDRAVLVPEHSYPFFRTAAEIVNARVDFAAETDEVVSVDALLASVRPDTGLVFVANPGNPTGTRVSANELKRLREGLREDILLVIDEAYGEFADHVDTPVFDMVRSANVVILRTFSKAYGMAGFRVGWGAFPPAIATEVRKVANPNNIPHACQIAAVAAVGDQDYMRETCAMTIALRETARSALIGSGLRVLPSFTNFLLIDLGSAETAHRIDAGLRTEGILLRAQGGADLPGMLRMTIGPEPVLTHAVDRLITLNEGATT